MSKLFCTFVANIVLTIVPCICYGWSEPLVLSSTRSYDPSVSINDSGNAAVAWITEAYENLTIQVSLLDKSWEGPVIVYSEGTNINPKIRIDDSKNVIVIWEGIDKTRHLMASQNVALKGWGEPLLLASNLSADSPSFSSNSQGQIVIGWVTTENTIEIIRSNIDTELVPVTAFNDDTGRKKDLKLRLDALGNIVAIWVNDDTDQLMFSQTSEGFYSEWSDPVPLNSITNYLSLSMATNSIGDIMISWIDLEQFGIQTLMCLNNQWQKSPSNHSIGTYSIRSGTSDKSFILSWLNAETATIQCVKFTDDTWGSIIDVSDSLAIDPFSLSTDNSGNIQFFWTDYFSGQIFFAQVYDEKLVSKPESISNGDLSRNPKTAISGAGTIAVWENFTGTEQTIQVTVGPTN